MIEIEIKAYPPSANSLYMRNKNGGQRLSPKHEMFRNIVFVNSRFKEKIKEYPVEVEILLYAPDNRRRDIDNVAKCVLDSLVNAGVLKDDSNKCLVSLRIANIGFLCDGLGKTIIKIKECSHNPQIEKYYSTYYTARQLSMSHNSCKSMLEKSGIKPIELILNDKPCKKISSEMLQKLKNFKNDAYEIKKLKRNSYEGMKRTKKADKLEDWLFPHTIISHSLSKLLERKNDDDCKHKSLLKQ